MVMPPDDRLRHLQAQAVDEMLSLLPAEIHAFAGSQYPLPVRATMLGDGEISIPSLRQALVAGRQGDVKDLLEPLLLGAELCEAAQGDRARFFLTDGQVQSHVFTGSKWRAGLALVLGGKDQRELVERLQERSFTVFCDQPDLPDTVYIGSRATAPVYYLQLMLRYGLVWGRIPPGADHEMGHFLERDWPGLLIIAQDLPPLKYLLALGLMKMGAPAVVPPSFPFPYGFRVVADSVAAMVEQGSRFPNLRQRYYRDEVVRLPDYCNPALVHEAFATGRHLGGGAHSFFCLRPAPHTGERVVVDGRPGDDIGILVEVAAEGLDADIAQAVERAAVKAANFLPGLRAYVERRSFHLELAPGVDLDPERLGEAIYWGIRLEYPALERITVRVILDPRVLAREAPAARAYSKERERTVAGMTEENTAEFCACTECRPFSLVHTCILTPDRIPMCAARTYVSVKAGARFGSSQVPWQRQSEKDLPMRLIFQKGRLLDAERGEYEGCNEVYRRLTGGALERVYLHSLRGYPHTSCGCFQNLAFWLEEVGGIGVMSRGSKATAPSGETWAMLANRAGGKQSPGIMGVSLPYIRSRHFLKGDGGIGNVVWVDSALHRRLQRLFRPGQRVATERDVRSMAELRAFLGR